MKLGRNQSCKPQLGLTCLLRCVNLAGLSHMRWPGELAEICPEKPCILLPAFQGQMLIIPVQTLLTSEGHRLERNHRLARFNHRRFARVLLLDDYVC